jgi:hypothetical protein
MDELPGSTYFRAAPVGIDGVEPAVAAKSTLLRGSRIEKNPSIFNTMLGPKTDEKLARDLRPHHGSSSPRIASSKPGA